MACRIVSRSEAQALGYPPEASQGSSPVSRKPEEEGVFFLCTEKPPQLSPLPFRPPLLFAGGPPPVSPPQPKKSLPPALHPMTELLRSFFLQTGHFALELNLSLAATGLSEKGKSKYHTELSLGDEGKIEKVYVEGDPDYQPAVIKADETYPLKIEMVKLRDDRQIIAKVRLGWHPLTANVMSALEEKFGITPEDYAKVGAAPGRLPDYPWQLLDLLLMKGEGLGSEGKKEVKSIGGIDPKKVVLDLRDSRIDMKVYVENEEIRLVEGPLAGLYFQGYPLRPDKKYRIEISGPLIPSRPGERGPVMTVWSGRGIGVDTPKGGVELALAQGEEPLQFEIEMDSPSLSGERPPAIWLLPYKNGAATIRTLPHDSSFPELKLEMTGGVSAGALAGPFPERAIGFRLWKSGPKVVWGSLTAHQMVFTGFGTDMRTTPNSKVVLSNGSLEVINGRPFFRSEIEGEAHGSVMYRLPKKRDEERQEVVGSLTFKFLRGRASLITRQDEKEDYVTTLTGSLVTEVPEMGLRVHNRRFGSLNVVMNDATMKGTGSLEVNITQGTVSWKHLPHHEEHHPLVVDAKGGFIHFIQDPSKVRPEIGRQLGKLAEKAVSRLFFRAQRIRFSTEELKLSGVKKIGGVSMLEIAQGRFSEIENRGEFWGRFFVHAGGIVYPGEILEKHRMKGALLKIGVLWSRTEEGNLRADISSILLQGEESSDSLTGMDARLCGFRRQRFDAFFDFSFGDEGPIVMKLAENLPFRVFLKNRIGGCTALGERP